MIHVDKILSSKRAAIKSVCTIQGQQDLVGLFDEGKFGAGALYSTPGHGGGREGSSLKEQNVEGTFHSWELLFP